MRQFARIEESKVMEIWEHPDLMISKIVFELVELDGEDPETGEAIKVQSQAEKQVQEQGTIADFFHPDLVWVEITKLETKPEQGWLYDGKSFTAPVILIPTVEQIAQEDARLRILEIEQAQARTVREAALGDKAAIARLRKMNDEIAELRKVAFPSAPAK